jgi:hypothetical protein
VEGLWGYENESNVDQDFRKPQDKDKKLQFIPLDYKKKFVGIAKLHPNYSSNVLQVKSYHRLKKKRKIRNDKKKKFR